MKAEKTNSIVEGVTKGRTTLRSKKMISAKQSLPVLTAVFGFALAWFIKPKGEHDVDVAKDAMHQTSANKIPKLIETKAKNASAKTNQSPTYLEDIPDLPPQLLEAQKKLDDDLQNGIILRDQGFLRRVTELLALSAEQQTGLMRLLMEKRQSLSIFSTPGLTPDVILERAEKAETAYHEALSKILTSSQITQYNQLIKQQSENRAIAKAQNQFAAILQNIDLSHEQHAAVQSALSQLALKEQPSADKSHIFHELYDTLGYGMVANRMATASATEAAISREENQAKVISEVAHNRQRESNEKLHALKAILTPAQWEQYKLTVEASDRAFYKSMGQSIKQKPIDPQFLTPDAEN